SICGCIYGSENGIFVRTICNWEPFDASQLILASELIYIEQTTPGDCDSSLLCYSCLIAGQDDPESEDEVYEVVDLTEYARRHQWWSRVFGNNSGPIAEKYSVATQLMMGGVTGWCAGYVFQRVGKIAATAIGGGFLLLQIANHSGYVQVDWKKVEKDVNKAKKHLKKKANKAAPEINTFIEEDSLGIIICRCQPLHHREGDSEAAL
uniref:FUN14 domain containing 1 n=1 Tax=Amphiprion percula TaxID=161767 RepID=A0A3P8RYH7_AMPPE